MRRIVMVGAVLLVASLLGGCGGKGGTTTAGGASASASPPASPSPSPSSTVDFATLTTWVDNAGLTSAALGGAKGLENKGALKFGIPCDTSPDPIPVWYGHTWQWVKGSPIEYLEHGVFAFTNLAGKNAIGLVQLRVQGCQNYEVDDPSGNAMMTINGDYAITPPAGVDGSYAWCELSTQLTPARYKGVKAMVCTALFSRGLIMMRVYVFGDQPTLASARHTLDTAIALAVPAFVAAVPAS